MSSGNGVGIASAQYAKAIRPAPVLRPPNGGATAKAIGVMKKHGHHNWTPGTLLKVPSVKKEKKMNWFKRKFAQWAREAWESADTAEVAVKSHESVSAKSSIRFTIYPASGGYVIEHYKQDRYKDSDGPTLTIVNHGDELGKAVEHIIALEALKS